MEFHGKSESIDSMEFHGSFFGKKLKFHGIPWNSGMWNNFFRRKFLSSMEFHAKKFMEHWGMEKSSMEFHGTLDLNKIPWNSILKFMLLKFHGIPWNHKCCSNVVQKVP